MEQTTKKNIILTGFMGTGKTTVGKLLALQLGYEFIDTDALIQERQGRAISDIFLESGETAFRQMEADLAQELGQRQGLVISTGGAVNVRLCKCSGVEPSRAGVLFGGNAR